MRRYLAILLLVGTALAARCPENEDYDSCASKPNTCEPTCKNREPTCNKTCRCGGCACDTGYVRHEACSENENFHECGLTRSCEVKCWAKSYKPVCHQPCAKNIRNCKPSASAIDFPSH